jgi:hypothetical protein
MDRLVGSGTCWSGTVMRVANDWKGVKQERAHERLDKLCTVVVASGPVCEHGGPGSDPIHQCCCWHDPRSDRSVNATGRHDHLADKWSDPS